MGPLSHHPIPSGSPARRLAFLKPGLVCLLALVTLVAALPAFAQTMPMPGEEPIPPTWPPTGPEGTRSVIWPTGRVNWLLSLHRTVQFLETWQNRVPGVNFGGEIEAEGGALAGVIQTDNTLEAIWVWSHWTRVTGDTQYLDEIANAWIYALQYPAWLEEGGTGDNYYRVHNCAWGLTAESEYRAATADTSKKWYARSCGDYIKNTPLVIYNTQRLNPFCQAWAAGNLFLYAEEANRPDWRQKALDYGEALITWVNYNPPTQLSAEYWAMSSGTVVWGLCNSVFRDDPVRGQAWIQTQGALVDTFQTWYNVPGDSYDWDNSWNVAYCNAHFAMGDVSGDAHYTGFGEKLARKLLSYDVDTDGGIQATTQDPPTIDMSWVSSYLAKFGVSRMLGTPPQQDAGVLSFLSPADNDTIYIPVGTPVPVQARVTNFGLQPVGPVQVDLTGPVSGSAAVYLGLGDVQDVVLHAGWTPTLPGFYRFTVTTVLAGDEVAENDTLTIHVQAIDPTDAPESASAGAPGIVRVTPNPSWDATRITLRLPAWRGGEASVHSVDGRRLASWRLDAGNERTVTLTWDGRDRDGSMAPSGVYFVLARAGDAASARRFARIAR
jgi:hypothetical protein